MTFTAVDLKRLKEFRLQGYHTWTAFEQNEIVDLIDALIVRLETSEAICQQVEIYITEKTPKMYRMKELLRVWRKSYGAAEGE